MDDGSDRTSSRIAFETAFDRPTGGFRFEFTQSYERFFRPMRGAIWRRTTGPVNFWWSVRSGVEEADLGQAIDSFNGMSAGAGHHVPAMLVGRTTGPFREMAFRFDGEDMLAGVRCIKLAAADSAHAVLLWIGKDDHLLRKLFESDHFDGRAREAAEDPPNLPEDQRRILDQLRREPPHPYTIEITIEYAPVFDHVVDAARFDFIPPHPTPDEQQPTK